jgi:hypothetical protein
VQQFFNGFFLNKIPLMKRLKWREVASIKVLYGLIGDDNDPSKHPDLFKFPRNEDGTLLSYTLQGQPYMEASIGISNIFKLLRVDLIKRITYLDHPGVPEFGIRARAKFDF